MEIKQISLDRILEPSIVTRSYMNEDQFQALIESIREVGVLEPIHVRPIDDKFEIVTGHRRFLASRALGLLNIPCIVDNWEGKEALVKRMHSDLNREDINPVDLAEMLQFQYEKHDFTIDNLAKRLGRSTSWVSGHMRVKDWPDCLKSLVKQELLSYSVAKELVKITDIPTLCDFADMAVVDNINVNTARAWARNWEADQIKVQYQNQPEVLQEKINQLFQPKGFCAGCKEEKPLDTMVRLPLCVPCSQWLQDLYKNRQAQDQETVQRGQSITKETTTTDPIPNTTD